MAAVEEAFRVCGAIDRVGEEQPAEEHDFRHQEDPHSDHSRLFLLFHADEMMRQPFNMSSVFSQSSSPMGGWWLVVGGWSKAFQPTTNHQPPTTIIYALSNSASRAC